MKRFMAFVGAAYYPGGGWDDFAGAFDTVEEAVAHAKDVARKESVGGSWWHVVDRDTLQKVAEQ